MILDLRSYIVVSFKPCGPTGFGASHIGVSCLNDKVRMNMYHYKSSDPLPPSRVEVPSPKNVKLHCGAHMLMIRIVHVDFIKQFCVIDTLIIT